MNTNQIKEAAVMAIKASDSYDAAIVRLQAEFAGRTSDAVRLVLLPIVAEHYGIAVGKAKAGPTAGQLAMQLGDKPSKEDQQRRNTAQTKLGRLVSSICTASTGGPETAAAKAARLFADATKAAAKLTPAAKRKLVESLALELGLKVK